MDFETIDLTKIKASQMTISIADYAISLSSPAYISMGKPEFVSFGYDRMRKLLSLQATEKNDGVKCLARNCCVRLNNKALIRYISMVSEIEFTDRVKKFTAEWDEQKQMLIVDLTKELIVNAEL